MISLFGRSICRGGVNAVSESKSACRILHLEGRICICRTSVFHASGIAKIVEAVKSIKKKREDYENEMAKPTARSDHLFYDMTEYYKKKFLKRQLRKQFRQLSYKDRLKHNLNYFKDEFKLMYKDLDEYFKCDKVIRYREGQIEMLFTFETPEKINAFKLITDSESGFGHSTAFLKAGNNGTVIFSGNISLDVQKTGEYVETGVAAMISKKKWRSFNTVYRYNWDAFNHMVFKVRGDGRTYMVNIQCPGHIDIHNFIVYQYPLYTRGGPYWQLTKIPFSKFACINKGRLQDKAHSLPTYKRIVSIGIVLMERNPGPFKLEVDYIGLENVIYDVEECAYELYHLPKHLGE